MSRIKVTDDASSLYKGEIIPDGHFTSKPSVPDRPTQVDITKCAPAVVMADQVQGWVRSAQIKALTQ